MSQIGKCPECGQSEFESSSEGGQICVWCGWEGETHDNFDSRPNFPKEGEQKEKDYSPLVAIHFNEEFDPQAIEAFVPSPIRREKIDTKIEYEEIDENSEEKLARLIKEDERKTMIPGKKYVWEDVKYVRRFLGLKKNENIEHLKEEISQLFPNYNLLKEVASIIEKPGLPARGIVIENEKHITPRRERIGLEVYCHYTTQENGFWFVDDYFSRFGLNRVNLDRILLYRLPISNRVSVNLSRNLDYGSIGFNFVRRCSKIYLEEGVEILFDPKVINQITDDFWDKLSLASKSDNSIDRLHFWKEIEENKGLIQPSSRGLILQHLPVAYFFAQQCWVGRVRALPEWGSWRKVCQEILRLIESDLKWCEMSFNEMNNWWDHWWEENGDGSTPSITTLQTNNSR